MKKIVIQNLSIALVSKIFSFISFLYIAKVLSQQEYGNFIYINLILSLLPLFQLGSMHGIAILLPKYITNYQETKEELFINYNSFSILLQIISVLVLFLFSIELSPWILVIIAFNYILSKYIENGQIYLNAHLLFEKANILKAIDQILRPVFILIIFYLYKNIESIFIAHLVTTFLVSIITFFITKIKFTLSFNMEIIKNIYKIGFFVYLTWGIDILFRSADRWFISQFYDLKELATYGFASALAMNIWLVAMSFFSPYTQLLYKAVAENNFLKVTEIVENTNKNLYILISVASVIVVMVYPYLLEFIVHKYFGTYFLFFILVIVSIFLSINNMYIYYMISNNLHFKLLKYQSVILSINLILNGIFSYYHLDIVYFGYSTILSLMIYFVLVRKYFYIDIRNKISKELVV